MPLVDKSAAGARRRPRFGEDTRLATRPRRVERAGRSSHGVEAVRSHKKSIGTVRFLGSRLITATLPSFPGTHLA
eukprot:1394531-Prymnesium_polylepis.1